MAIVQKGELIRKGRIELGTELVPVAGGEVKVRGLTRRETYVINDECGDNQEERELLIVAAGMVEPAMTLEEVRAWSENGVSGELQDVSIRIGRLSRLMPESAKEATKSVSQRGRNRV